MHGRMVETQNNLRRKKLYRTNQGYRDNVRVPIQFGRESQSQHLKRLFFLKNIRIHPSIAALLLVQSNETS